MAFDLGNALGNYALPKYGAFVFVDRVDLPRVLRIVFNSRDVAVNTEARFILGAVEGRRHGELVTAYNGCRVSQAGNREFPADVLRGAGVPLRRLAGTFDDACCERTTKLRRVLRRRFLSGNCAGDPGDKD